MERTYTLEQASSVLPEARQRIVEVAAMAGELQRMAQTIDQGAADDGAIPDAKALEARIDESLGWFRDRDIQVKGVAPALLDFPARAVADGETVDVLLCWREGEDDIAFYHPRETGYLGRQPVGFLEQV